MKTKNLLKGGLVATVFCISSLGINYSRQVRNIAGERITINKLTLGNQAQAYCNEAQYPGESNNGRCSGMSFLPESRCLLATSNENCTGGHIY